MWRAKKPSRLEMSSRSPAALFATLVSWLLTKLYGSLPRLKTNSVVLDSARSEINLARAKLSLSSPSRPCPLASSTGCSCSTSSRTRQRHHHLQPPPPSVHMSTVAISVATVTGAHQEGGLVRSFGAVFHASPLGDRDIFVFTRGSTIRAALLEVSKHETASGTAVPFFAINLLTLPSPLRYCRAYSLPWQEPSKVSPL